jgi:hypothetical protein
MREADPVVRTPILGRPEPLSGKESSWACEPTLHRRRLVGGGVVQHQVHIEIGGHFGPEEALDCACGLYLNDPTAWTQPPTN